MRCEELQDLIEPIAAGDLVPTDEVARHLAGCASCGSALALGRRIDHALAALEVPAASPAFAASVMRRIRRQRWRSEQYLDLGFNATIIVSVALVVGGIWLALNLTGLAAVTAGTVTVFSNGLHELLLRVAPRLPIYVGAVMLMMSAFALWWWAERGWSV
jgi:anti-sigma factor RsiW